MFFHWFPVVLLVAIATVVAGGFIDSDIWMKNKPSSAEQVGRNVKFVFSVNKTFAYWFPLRDIDELPKVAEFNRSLPTMIYWHGWMENGTHDVSTTAIRGAFMDAGGYNVITADWSRYSQNVHYISTVIPQMKVIAATFAENLIRFFRLYDSTQLMLVGHSLGGQMVAKVGRHVRELSSDKYQISNIFALDPAGPGFEDQPFNGMEPISSTDADYVQVIHTNGGNLGMQYRCGTIDFYPNGGVHQRGCNMDAGSRMFSVASMPCNHYRSWHFFQESLRNPLSFPAVRCLSYEDFLNIEKGGACFLDDIVYMGLPANRTAKGKYYLSTQMNIFNLGRGLSGLKPVNITNQQLPVAQRYFIADEVDSFEYDFQNNYL